MRGKHQHVRRDVTVFLTLQVVLWKEKQPKPNTPSTHPPPSQSLSLFFNEKTLNIPAYLFGKFHYDSFCTFFKFVFCILFLLL